MAGDWIKMRVDLRDDPAVIAIAAATDLHEDTVVGKLHKLWSWANRQTTDGNAVGVTLSWIDRYLGATGFAEAMVEATWLAETTHLGGGIRFPEFGRHNSESAKRRALTARRVAKHRNAGNVTTALAREEKRREEKSKGETPLAPFDPTGANVPEGLQTEAFRRAWAEWIEHRKQIRKKLTPLAVTKQLTRLEKMGETRALATIQHTIEKGWIGLQEPEPEPGQKPAFTSRGRDLGGDQ